MRRQSKHSKLRWAAVVGAALSTTGCDDDFQSPSVLDSLRVLAVQASSPYAKPGERVDMEMLWHDGKSPPDEPREVQIMWIGGCFNPAGDLYQGCFRPLGELLSKAESDPSVLQYLGSGPTFSLNIPEDIISRRPRAEGVDPYGLAYVFFAICAGELRPAEPGPDGIPLGCFDPSGNRLGSQDFVPGYFGLFSYDDRSNANPIVTGLELSGTAVPEGEEPHLPRCAGDCTAVPIKPIIDPSSAELDPGATDFEGNQLGEQMWVNYYASGGKLKSSARLVNDALKGWNDDNGTEFTPPAEPGRVVLYAVVHDNRGGVAWVKQPVWID